MTPLNMPDGHDRKTSHLGFTLIEVIVAIAISLLIVLAISATYFVTQKTYIKADNQAEISQNGRVILDRLARELRQTPEIITPLPANDFDPNGLPNEIFFRDGHDILQITYIRYYLDSTNIMRRVEAYYFPASTTEYVPYDALNPLPPNGLPLITILEDKLIGEYISDLEFYGNRPVYINLHLHKNKQDMIISTSIFGRNL